MSLRTYADHPTNWKYEVDFSYKYGLFMLEAGIAFFDEKIVDLKYRLGCGRCFSDRVDLNYKDISFPVSVSVDLDYEESVFFCQLGVEFIYNRYVQKRIDLRNQNTSEFYSSSEFNFNRSIFFIGLGYKYNFYEQ